MNIEKKNPQPGSFHTPEKDIKETSDLNISNENPEQARAFGPESAKGLKQQLEAFRDILHPEAKNIYYPCCQNDITLSEVFPQSRIIYADLDKNTVEMLKKHGYEVYEADANTFRPPEVPDIVMLENPQISAKGPASVLKEGGYLVCNNYHNTATELHDNNDFEIMGVIARGKEGRIVLDNQELEDYFRPINTDEEFKKLKPGWTSTLEYEGALGLIKELGDEGSYEKVVSGQSTAMAEYLKLLKKYEHKKIHGSNRITWGDATGLVYSLETVFPPKKGVVDNMFVFKKKLKKPQ